MPLALYALTAGALVNAACALALSYEFLMAARSLAAFALVTLPGLAIAITSMRRGKREAAA